MDEGEGFVNDGKIKKNFLQVFFFLLLEQYICIRFPKAGSRKEKEAGVSESVNCETPIQKWYSGVKN